MLSTLRNYVYTNGPAFAALIVIVLLSASGRALILWLSNGDFAVKNPRINHLLNSASRLNLIGVIQAIINQLPPVKIPLPLLGMKVSDNTNKIQKVDDAVSQHDDRIKSLEDQMSPKTPNTSGDAKSAGRLLSIAIVPMIFIGLISTTLNLTHCNAVPALPPVTAQDVATSVEDGCAFTGVLAPNLQTAATICEKLAPVLSPIVSKIIDELESLRKGSSTPPAAQLLNYVPWKINGKTVGYIWPTLLDAANKKVAELDAGVIGGGGAGQ